MQKIVPNLWFDTEAEEAANLALVRPREGEATGIETRIGLESADSTRTTPPCASAVSTWIPR